MRFARYMESESIPEWRKAYLDYKGLLATLSKVEKQQYNSPSSQSAAPVRHRRPWRSATSESMSPPARSLSQWLAGKLHRPAVGQNLAGEDMVTTFTDAEGTQHSLVFSSDAERQFFHKLDQEFSRVARFYTEYERVAKQKLVALKTQMQLVAEYGRLLADLSEPSWEEAVADPTWKRWVLYPVRWLRRKRAYGPASSFSMPFKEYQGQRTSYQTARSRLKRALAEYYRSLELLRSYRNVNAAGFRSVLKRFNRVSLNSEIDCGLL
ncbi:SPX domain-domain-containing protein [Syncephalastrum racemosum]|uniref:SPX domain-domain-containing protein n=1 Tax=Syncephalastrum racemosum TaxID=13706 RepID=A0A1X2H570_SYNRA|nr:SPX domain-domain-containing protein [Syncephalastrum racemosum]